MCKIQVTTLLQLAELLITPIYDYLFQNMCRHYAQTYTHSIGIVIFLNSLEKGSLTFIFESHFYG